MLGHNGHCPVTRSNVNRFPFSADTDATQSSGGTDQVDLLTCGQCQRVFLLSDICRFVQHKVAGCSKDPAQNCNSGGGGSDDNGPQQLDNGLSSAKHTTKQHRSQSPSAADEGGAQHRRPLPSSTPKRSSANNGDDMDHGASSEDEPSHRVAGRVKQGSESSEDLGFKKSNRSASSCVDAESNTTNTGEYS